MASLPLLVADYSSLSKEAGRRHGDVRDAADKAAQLLKANKEAALDELKTDPPPAQHPLYQPIFLASSTRNAKVIALAVSALQRLIVAGAVPKTLVKQILDTLEQVIAQGVEIQLKVLQTLVSLLTTTTSITTASGRVRTDKLVQGEELGQALELSHRLSTSKIPVVASTASATLRQLFMFVFDRVGEEDALVASASSPSSPFLPPATFDVDVPPLEEDRAAAIGALPKQVRRRLIEGDAPESPNPDSLAEEGEGEGAAAAEEERRRSEENRARSIKLRPAARDAYLLLEDLCLLISGTVEGGPDGEPSFLRWGSLSRTFGLELVESIVSGFGPIVRTHPELLLVLRAHLCPLLIRFLSSPPHSQLSSSTSFTFSFPLTLRLTRVIFLLLKQFSDLLTLESEVFLTMFVRVIGPGDKGEGEGGHPAGPAAGTNSPLWMRVLALEIFRGLCGDFTLMMKFYQRYDAATKEKQAQATREGGKSPQPGGSTVFSDLMTAFNRLATEKPTALGVGAAVVYGSSLAPVFAPGSSAHPHSGSSAAASASTTTLGVTTGSHVIDSAMGMGLGLAQVAGSVVGSAAAAAGAVATGAAGGAAGPSLSSTTASMKLQCIDQLDKAEPPPIPENYIFLLALQCLSALADGFASYTLQAYGGVVARQARAAGEEPASAAAPRALDWDQLDRTFPGDAQLASLKVVRAMAETSWPALLASLSFFIATALSDDLFADVVASLQNFTSVLGVLNLETPREAFLTSLCKFAMPPSVVSYLTSQEHHSSARPTAAGGASAAAAAATAVLSAGAESLALLAGAGGSTALPIGLSARNLACLRALIAVAHYLAGSLGLSWFAVFETLQNADYVLRTTASARGTKKRQAGPLVSASAAGAGGAAPGTPGRAGGAGTAGTGANGAVLPGAGGEGQQLPVLPSEAEEQAVQQSIASLFDVSKALDDGAFRLFLGALCRLSGEMIGLQMSEEGAVVGHEGGAGGVGGSGSTTPLETPNRRRSSGLSALGQTKAGGFGEKSFGIAKIGAVAVLNIQRLIRRPPDVGWDLATSHLLYVLHAVLAPTPVPLQAADVLDQVLVLAPKNLDAEPVELQRRVQTQVLAALAAQAQPAPRLQTATDVDIRRLALECLLKILESNGHAFVAGWDRIFHILRTACPSSHYIAPPSPVPSSSARRSIDTITEHDAVGPMTPMRSSVGPGGYFASGGAGGEGPGAARSSAKTAVLVRTSFPSLQLICTDFLDALDGGEIRHCIETLAEFGKQVEDVNVALTAGGLLWSVSDHVQAKHAQQAGPEGDLWMFLLSNLLNLARDSRQDVRDSAITNIFRSISMYGGSLSKETWKACCWEVVFPLIEDLSSVISEHNHRSADDAGEMSEETVPQANGPPIRLVDKQYDDSKVLALRSVGDVFFEYLPQIVKVERFEDVWRAFVSQLRRSFVDDRPVPATAAMQALEKVLTVSLDMADASRIASSWEVAWSTWDEIGKAIEENAAAEGDSKLYTQVNLEAFVRVVLPIYTPPYITFDLSRIERLLAVLKAVLAYTRSPDYRPDVDGLSPLQSVILEVVAVIKLDDVPGAAAAVLSDLAEYSKLAFTAPFESTPDSGLAGRPKIPQQVTYIALTKEVMPHVQWLYRKYRDDVSVYEQGAVEKMLEAYSLPMELKHDCPAPAKFGSAEPLWKTATVNFLKAVRDVVAGLQQFGSELTESSHVAIWEKIVDGFAGALLAESGAFAHKTVEDVHHEENFDLALLVSLEHDVLPHIGASVVPDRLIRRLAKTLQIAARLYQLDYPYTTTAADLLSPSSAADTPPATPPEPRFDLDFDRQAKGEMHGTTVEVVPVGRERFSYWCSDLLFLLCEVDGSVPDDSPRRRIPALALPFLMNRCAAAIRTYVADAALRGKIPFPRLRQEELVYLLQKLLNLRIPEGSLWASSQPNPSEAVSSPVTLDASLPIPDLVRSALLRSSQAHLYELHPLFTDLLSLSNLSPSIVAPYVPQRYLVSLAEDGEQSFEGLPSGFEVGRIGRSGGKEERGETQVVKLVLAALAKVGQEIGAGSFLS
ncbi:hypothetical protein JCM8097_001397 [Rhodosporidiobolus ruineniae]